jgi:hypothetical protein
MRKPEYWEDDEIWEAYEWWLKENPPVEPQPLSELEQAVEDARGGPIPTPLLGFA